MQAFEQGAVDYLVKPFDEARLADTVQRLRGPALPNDMLAPLIDRLAEKTRAQTPQVRHLQWMKASVGNSVRPIPVDEVIFLRSDEKYTLVVWQGGEALIRKTIASSSTSSTAGASCRSTAR